MATSAAQPRDTSEPARGPHSPALPALIALAAVLIAGAVRLPPPQADEVLLDTDSAFHSRMIAAVSATGSLPDADPKYAADPPRDNRRMCPAAYHHLAAGSFRALNRMTPTSWPEFLRVWGVICGALPVLPLCALVWLLTRRAAETALAGVLFAVATPTVLRSAFHIVRYESMGVFLLLILATLIVRWRSDPPVSPRLAWTLLAGCATAGWAGAGMWRLFAPLAAMVLVSAVAADFTAPGVCRSVTRPALAVAAGCLTAWPSFDFYRLAETSEVPLLLPPLAAAGIAALACSAPVAAWLTRRSGPTRWSLLASLLSAVVLAAGFGTAAGRAWLAPILGGPLGSGSDALAPVLVSEMLPVDFATFWSWHFLSYLPALYALVLLAGAVRSGRPGPDAFPAIAATLGIGLTLLFNRMVFIGLPLLLAHLAAAVARLDSLPLPRSAGRPTGRILRAAALGLMLPLLIGFALQSRASLELLARPSPDRAGAYAWLSRQAAARIAASWSRGYELQLYTPAVTIMDGFLEDVENRSRIQEFTSALFAPDAGDRLAAFCQRHQTPYLLLDNTYLLPLCRRLGKPWSSWFRLDDTPAGSRVEILPAGRRIAWLRLMSVSGRSGNFLRTYASGNLVVFEVGPNPAPGANR
jgi:hypothetical protein